MSGKALQHAWHCIERQTAYAHLNAFTNLANAASLGESAGAADAQTSSLPLHGKLVAVKDNIATTTLPTTASSRILSSYTSPYPATVVSLLADSGAILAGKTNLDEFGMGSHSRAPFPGPVLSPCKRDGTALSPGGSSGGSAVAVATEQCWAALGTDTGGSVRLPAAYTGTVGFKPSYGRLSRWGVIAYANSLDTVGMLSRRVADARTLYSVLNRYDAQDPTSLPDSVRTRVNEKIVGRRRGEPDKSLRIGVPVDYNISTLSPAVKSTWSRILSSLQERGHTLVPVSLPTTRHALSAYYILAPAEASSNLAKYDGVRYGTRAASPDADLASSMPLFAKTRGEGFGPEVKRRILLGAYTLSSEAIDNYFIRAQKIRRLVSQDFNRVFGLEHPLLQPSSPTITNRTASAAGYDGDGSADVDVLITPTAPTLPPTLEEVEGQTPVESYMNDVFTVPASLAGLPAVSVPVALSGAGKNSASSGEVGDAGGEGDVTVAGMQITGQFGDDEMVLHVAELIEDMEQ